MQETETTFSTSSEDLIRKLGSFKIIERPREWDVLPGVTLINYHCTADLWELLPLPLPGSVAVTVVFRNLSLWGISWPSSG